MNEIITAMDKEYIKGFSLLGGEPFEKGKSRGGTIYFKNNKGTFSE